MSDLAAAARNEDQKQQLQEYYRFQVCEDAELVKVLSELGAARTKEAAVYASIPTSLAWKETAKPKPAFVLNRGEYDQPGRPRPRVTPAVLPPMKNEWPNDRLGLAKWLVDPGHPLTARVTVNRFWQQVFGVGIVKTSEDFGTRRICRRIRNCSTGWQWIFERAAGT